MIDRLTKIGPVVVLDDEADPYARIVAESATLGDGERRVFVVPMPDASIARRAEVVHEAVQRYGATRQTAQVFEEVGELLVALVRHDRRRGSRDAVIDEIADVSILLAQLAAIWGAEDVEQAIDAKIERLAARLADPAITGDDHAVTFRPERE